MPEASTRLPLHTSGLASMIHDLLHVLVWPSLAYFGGEAVSVSFFMWLEINLFVTATSCCSFKSCIIYLYLVVGLALSKVILFDGKLAVLKVVLCV